MLASLKLKLAVIVEKLRLAITFVNANVAKFVHVLGGYLGGSVIALFSIKIAILVVFVIAVGKEVYDKGARNEELKSSIFDVFITTLGGMVGALIIFIARKWV